MSETTLKFNNIRLNKKEFHKSKEPIDLLLVNVDQIVVSNKFKHNNEGFKHFIGYQEGETVKIIMHYFTSNEWVRKNMSFFIKDGKVWDKHDKIWDGIKNKLGIKSHSEPVHEYR